MNKKFKENVDSWIKQFEKDIFLINDKIKHLYSVLDLQHKNNQKMIKILKEIKK